MKPLRANLITAAAFIYYWADGGGGGGARGLVEAGPWEAEGEGKLLQLCSFSREMLNLCVTSPELNYWGAGRVQRSGSISQHAPGGSNKIPTQSHTHTRTLWHQQYCDSPPIGSCCSWLSEVLLTSFSWTWTEFAWKKQLPSGRPQRTCVCVCMYMSSKMFSRIYLWHLFHLLLCLWDQSRGFLLKRRGKSIYLI